MARQKIARLSDRNVRQGLIERSEVDHHAHRWPEPASSLLDGCRRSAHRHRADIEIAADERQLPGDGTRNAEQQRLTVIPARDFRSLALFSELKSPPERSYELLVVALEPTLGTLAQQLFDGRVGNGGGVILVQLRRRRMRDV